MSDAAVSVLRMTHDKPHGVRQNEEGTARSGVVKKRKRKRGGVLKKAFTSVRQEKKLLRENMCIRASWLVLCSKYLMSWCQEDPTLYQECFSLSDAVKIIQMHHQQYQCTTIQISQVKEILSGSPLRNIGKGSCIFVAASKTIDGGGWVLETKDQGGKKLPPKSSVLASYLPLDEDMQEAKAMFCNAVIGFMVMPTLYMSKEATPSEFVADVARDDRVILEGHLVRFDPPFSYPESNSVKMDGGSGGYFRMLLGDEKSKRYKGIRKLVAKHADYIKRQHLLYKESSS